MPYRALPHDTEHTYVDHAMAAMWHPAVSSLAKEIFRIFSSQVEFIPFVCESCMTILDTSWICYKMFNYLWWMSFLVSMNKPIVQWLAECNISKLWELKTQPRGEGKAITKQLLHIISIFLVAQTCQEWQGQPLGWKAPVRSVWAEPSCLGLFLVAGFLRFTSPFYSSATCLLD